MILKNGEQNELIYENERMKQFRSSFSNTYYDAETNKFYKEQQVPFESSQDIKVPASLKIHRSSGDMMQRNQNEGNFADG